MSGEFHRRRGDGLETRRLSPPAASGSTRGSMRTVAVAHYSLLRTAAEHSPVSSYPRHTKGWHTSMCSAVPLAAHEACPSSKPSTDPFTSPAKSSYHTFRRGYRPGAKVYQHDLAARLSAIRYRATGNETMDRQAQFWFGFGQGAPLAIQATGNETMDGQAQFWFGFGQGAPLAIVILITVGWWLIKDNQISPQRRGMIFTAVVAIVLAANAGYAWVRMVWKREEARARFREIPEKITLPPRPSNADASKNFNAFDLLDQAPSPGAGEESNTKLGEPGVGPELTVDKDPGIAPELAPTAPVQNHSTGNPPRDHKVAEHDEVRR